MSQIRLVLGGLGLSAVLCGCISLSYPLSDDPAGSEVGPAQSPSSSERPTRDPESPPSTFAEPELPEPALRWSDLTRLARAHQTQGEFEEAEQRLEQAAVQVSGLPAYHASRRTVFGVRARFAEFIALRGDLERADALADQLISEAEAEPAIGGAALVSLAMSVAERRSAASAASSSGGGEEQSAEPASQLSILRVALLAAQRGRANRVRLQLAVSIADQAYLEGEMDLARNAIDQAIVDARILVPGNLGQWALLRIERARIAAAQNDYELAAADAIRANQIFEEISADQTNRGIGEAILAEILAKQGEGEEATRIVRNARARLDAEEPIHGHAQRVILGALARVEIANGNSEDARKYYAEALEVPGMDLLRDRFLIRELSAEAVALDASSSSTPVSSPSLSPE